MIMITENLHLFTLRPKLLRGLRAGLLCVSCIPVLAQAQEHFNPKGSGATGHTSSLQAELRETLPFADERDFEEARRGFIAEPDSRQILGASGNIVWDMARYDFLLSGDDYDTMHPSLQRQATLNMNFGLFEVVPDFLYQVRGFDLANMTLVKGNTGWIIFDTLLTNETAAAAFALTSEHLGDYPIKAVVYSHSHIDHFGGVLGIISEAEVAAGSVQVIAPAGSCRKRFQRMFMRVTPCLAEHHCSTGG